MIVKSKIEQLILRRIKHAEDKVKQLKQKHGDNPGKTHTYHGGWDLGYWEGQVSAYYNILDNIEAGTKNNNE